MADALNTRASNAVGHASPSRRANPDRTMKLSLRSVALSLLVACVPAAAAVAQEAATSAEAPTSPGQAFIQAKADQIIAVINTRPSTDPERASRREALRAAVRDFIDLPTLAQRTLGEHWDTRTDEQRAEFVALLTELVETSYLRGLRDDGVDRDDATVVFVGERSARGRITVEATVSFDGSTHHVEARMLPRDGGGYIVFDVVTDDVSLEESYAESFERIIRDHGWDELLARMRTRLAEMQAD
jgi:phospholipid transport system substrate-binding protein